MEQSKPVIGRPTLPKDKKRTYMFRVCLNVAERKKLEQLANKNNQTSGDFFRTILSTTIN